MFNHLPSLNSLRVFEAAARQKSFKAAAQELYVTPTAVSHQIRKLEDKLGSLLFERKTRAIELTAEGNRLSQVMHRSLQEISSIWEELADIQSRLTISTTASFAAMWLVPRLNSFYTQHPDIEVEVRTGEALVDVDKDRRIDIAIRYGIEDSIPTEAQVLVMERFGKFVNPTYLKSLSSIGDATLLETQWKNTTLPEISWRQHFSEEQKNSSKKIRQFDQEHHVIQAALAGQGIALVSSLLVQTPLEQGWLEEYDKEHCIPGMTYYLAISPEKNRDRKVTVFRDWLIRELKLVDDCV